MWLETYGDAVTAENSSQFVWDPLHIRGNNKGFVCCCWFGGVFISGYLRLFLYARSFEAPVFITTMAEGCFDMFFVTLLVFWISNNCVSSVEKCPKHTKFVLQGVVWLKWEILVCVSWFAIHANFNATIRLACYQSVQKWQTPLLFRVIGKLMWGSKLLMWSVKSRARSLSIMMNVSSTYRIQVRGGWEANVIALTSKFSMYKLAIIGLTGSPIVQPWSCWYICPLNLK